jgi:hypothetical protein
MRLVIRYWIFVIGTAAFGGGAGCSTGQPAEDVGPVASPK